MNNKLIESMRLRLESQALEAEMQIERIIKKESMAQDDLLSLEDYLQILSNCKIKTRILVEMRTSLLGDVKRTASPNIPGPSRTPRPAGPANPISNIKGSIPASTDRPAVPQSPGREPLKEKLDKINESLDSTSLSEKLRQQMLDENASRKAAEKPQVPRVTKKRTKR